MHTTIAVSDYRETSLQIWNFIQIQKLGSRSSNYNDLNMVWANEILFWI